MATTPVFDPTQPYTEVFDQAKPYTETAKPVFDPTQPYTEVSRRDRLKELEGQITSSVDAPADVKAKLGDDYFKENQAYREERGLLGRVKDWFADADFKGAASSIRDTINTFTTEQIARDVTNVAAKSLAKKALAGEQLTTADILKEGLIGAGKVAGADVVGLGVGAADTVQALASGIAGVGSEASSILGAKDLAAAIDLEKVKQSAEKEEAVKDLKEGLGIEDVGSFEGARAVGGLAPVGLPGAQKVLQGLGKAGEKAGEGISTGLKKGAGLALRGGSGAAKLGTDVATSAVGIGLKHIPFPGAGIAGSVVAASPLFSKTGLSGFSKYIKAAIDAVQDTEVPIATVDGKKIAVTPVAMLKKVSMSENIGGFMDDVKTRMFEKPSGAGEILQKTKLGQSIVDDAEKVGADLIAAQDKVIKDLKTKLAKRGVGNFKKSLLTSDLNAAEARQASIAAGVEVVKRLKAVEKLTDAAGTALADATLGATAGTAFAAATSTPGSKNAFAEGLVNGAFYGTLLTNLGRAAINHAQENPNATTKTLVSPKDIELIVDTPEFATAVRQNTLDLVKHPSPEIEIVDNVPEDAIWVNAPSTVQAMPAKSTGLEVAGSVQKNAPAMLESGSAPKALLALQPGSTKAVGVLESVSVPKALRAPMAEELPLGNTKASAPDMTALRARVEKTQNVIDELSAKDVTEGLTDNELVTLEQAEATIARDVETLKGLEASELTSAKKPRKVLAMEKTTKDAGPSMAKKNVLSAVDSVLKRKTRMTDTSIGDAVKHIEDLDLDSLSPDDSAAVTKALESIQKEYDELASKIEKSGVAFRTGQTGIMATLKNAAHNITNYGNYANKAVELNAVLKKVKAGKATPKEIEQLKEEDIDIDDIDGEIDKNWKHYKRLSDAYNDTNRFLSKEGKHITFLSDELRGIQ